MRRTERGCSRSRPAVPLNIENGILACVADMMEEVRSYFELRTAYNRKQRRNSEAAQERKRRHDDRIKTKQSKKKSLNEEISSVEQSGGQTQCCMIGCAPN